MKFAVINEHRHYFQKHQSIELEGLLSNKQLEKLKLGVKSSLGLRLNTPTEKLYRIPAETQFLEGRDVWRSNEDAKKIILVDHFAEIASELLEKRPLRFGYDQFFPETPDKAFFYKETIPYDTLLSKKATLEEISCLQGVQCGVIICLSSLIEPENDSLPDEDSTEASQSIFPKKEGNMTYFLPSKEIDFSELRQRPKQQFLMLVYTEKTALYILQDKDPNAHFLKKLGYVFGDRLKDDLNPIVWR